jgi:hypothetical protein
MTMTPKSRRSFAQNIFRVHAAARRLLGLAPRLLAVATALIVMPMMGGAARAATLTYTLSDADLTSFLWGTITSVTGTLTLGPTTTSSAVTVTEPATYGATYTFTGKINGAGYTEVSQFQVPCVILGCTTPPTAYAGLSLQPPIGAATQYISADFGDGGYGGEYGGTVLATLTSGPSPSPAPEPAAWALMVLGVGFVGAGLRRRAAKAPLRA